MSEQQKFPFEIYNAGLSRENLCSIQSVVPTYLYLPIMWSNFLSKCLLSKSLKRQKLLWAEQYFDTSHFTRKNVIKIRAKWKENRITYLCSLHASASAFKLKSFRINWKSFSRVKHSAKRQPSTISFSDRISFLFIRGNNLLRKLRIFHGLKFISGDED